MGSLGDSRSLIPWRKSLTTTTTTPSAAMKSAAVLALAVCAVLATLASPVAARPTSTGHVLFARSCADCGEDTFCEFAYPGAPENQVACISNAMTRKSLYRRYGSAMTSCDGYTANGSCQNMITNGFVDAATCEALCVADADCKAFSRREDNGLCERYYWVAAKVPETNVVFKVKGTCPGDTCP
ncbi:hypothetical protein DFJ74DRAFT_654293 [Hyaloraphidium curvatum]|nr:hypothetical protein DFJ74DRAFT_654293 [Hyaloraphidium curvatum]